MKHFSDVAQCWHGVVCWIEQDENGKDFVAVYSANAAETQVEIDDWLRDVTAKLNAGLSIEEVDTRVGETMAANVDKLRS